ncbi:DUF2953 domain-containing protein [Paenibacillus sp. J2TS4]|uniref:DUF2953 domain-containing protein n=1 Tax=Paenibacillus sp. J2TS4 TaxID=2807194 RepID=UPI001B0C63CA|nr:DUF2953 domain-containing protein [Paenibacillus sp. J2TS4]GIP32340.1 hypothetical protein J2TS4_15500 [Paenibacillus sp. J2TS4]
MLIFWLFLAAALIVVAVIVFSSHLTFKLYVSRVRENDKIYIQLNALFGMIRLKYEVSALMFKSLEKGLKMKTSQINENKATKMNDTEDLINLDKIKQYYHNFKVFLSQISNYWEWMKGTLSRVKIKRLEWSTHVGAGDAPETAVLTGVVWSLKASLLGYLQQYVRLQSEPKINVQPQYNRTLFTTEVVCIAKIRLGYAIVAGLMLLIRMMKVKGGIKTWQTILSKA